EQLERKDSTHPSLCEEWDADLDYVLALSLQNESNPHDIPRGFWDSYYTKELLLVEEATAAASFADAEAVLLPCEFCEELYPAEELILHQTGCNPASAFASFSKRSSQNPRGYDGLHAVRSKSYRSLSSSLPQAVQAEGNIMLPCEFCGIQLEEEVLFHHQHHCDLRPASPATSLPPPQLLPPQADRDRTDSPELVRRRVRHQG
ncbi:TRAD1 protein, partial [Heliornis fulica]|nr:TRAD1 protein [Heliornis fulica]